MNSEVIYKIAEFNFFKNIYYTLRNISVIHLLHAILNFSESQKL